MTQVVELYCPKCRRTVSANFYTLPPRIPVVKGIDWCNWCDCPMLPTLPPETR